MASLPIGNNLPTGTVTFLFTDIQGSTPLWERQPEKMAVAQQLHNQVLRQAIEVNGGIVFQIIGDAFAAAFPTAPLAVRAAIEGQQALHSAPWDDLGPIRVRMGLHTGTAELDPQLDSPYAGSHTLNRVSRVMSAGYGGQILLSQETYELVRRDLPEGSTLKDLGEHRLKGMIELEHLYQVVVPDLQSDFPPLSTSVAHPHNLPVRLTSFIGRKTEIEALCEMLLRTDIRLLTITGVGGIGKTSLALQMGRGLLESFRDGVFFVDLATIKDPGLVITAVAGALSLHEMPGKSLKNVLEEHLAQRELLLILDNFEQVISAGDKLLGLLKSAPQLKIVVTSRELLHVSPEYQFSLSPLQLPPLQSSPENLEENEAMRLFIERAQAIRPEIRLTPENGAIIAEICRKLDGLPLAIELIAARMRLFNLQQLLQQLSNRLHVLSGGWQDLPPRHRTMRSAITWSYELLSEDEKRLFSRLAIFPGSFTLEAAEAICGAGELDILSRMESLLDKHLVNRLETDSQSRFWLFETLREYGLELLTASGKSKSIAASHAAYYAELTHINGPNYGGLNYSLWDLERSNLRTAFDWALENQDSALCFKIGSNFFAWERQVGEGRQLISRALALPNTQAHTSQRGSLLYSAAALALLSRDFSAARIFIDELEIIYQELNDPYKLWEHTFLRGVLSMGMGDYEEAITLFLTGRDQLNDFDYAVVSVSLASSTLQLHDLDRAKAYIQDAQDHLIRAGEWTYPYLVDCLTIQGFIALEENLPLQAEEYFHQAFKLAMELFVQARMGAIYQGLGGAALKTGDLVSAVNWMSLAWTIEKTTGYASRVIVDTLQERYLKDLKGRLDPAAFNAYWQVGQQLTIDQAIAYGEEHLCT